MRYDDWNGLIFRHYFDTDSTYPVYFRITEEELAGIARPFFPDGFKEQSIVADFCRLFQDKAHGYNGTKEYFLDFVDNVLKKGFSKDNIPTVFPVIALLMLPLKQSFIDGKCEPNDYYSILNEYLRKHFIIGYGKDELIGSADFARLELNKLWQRMESWAQRSGFNYTTKGCTSVTYVGPLWSEYFLSQDIIGKALSIVKENYGNNTDNKAIIKALCDNADYLGLHKGIVKYFSDHYAGVISGLLR